MRNLFDQYSQPENRLSHALLSSLAADRRLLNSFVLWATGKSTRNLRLEILEQRLPGQTTEVAEEEAAVRGIPDGCIIDGSGWALLLENKFAAHINKD